MPPLHHALKMQKHGYRQSNIQNWKYTHSILDRFHNAVSAAACNAFKAVTSVTVACRTCVCETILIYLQLKERYEHCSMRLVLFRSLIGSSHPRGCTTTASSNIKEQQQRGLLERIRTIHDNNYHQNSNSDKSSQSSFRQFDGVELSLSQLRMTSDVVHSCAEQQLRILCRIHPTSVRDAGAQLDQLSNLVSSASSPSSSILDLVSMHHSNFPTFESATSYLYQVLPLAAQFLESYPHIGNSHGQQNAHGKPLDTHVMGISHTLLPPLSGDSSNSNYLHFLSNMVDILPPTRLSLHATQVADMYRYTMRKTHDKLDNPTTTTTSNEEERSELFQSIVEHTDHIYFDDSMDDIHTTFATRNKKKQNKMPTQESCTTDSDSRMAQSFDSTGLNQLWDWQQYVSGSNETYATIMTSSGEPPPL